MQPNGAFAPLWGGLVGTGPGAGIGLIFVITGAIGALVPLIGYLVPAVRNIEEILPDYVATPQMGELKGLQAEAALS
jgi:hypothetical protein